MCLTPEIQKPDTGADDIEKFFKNNLRRGNTGRDDGNILF